MEKVSFHSSSKEALGKCGNEADLNEETYNSFSSSDGCNGIAERKRAGEEAAPMEGSDAEDQSLPELEVSEQKIADGECCDHEEVGTQTPPRPVPIACQHIEGPREDKGSKAADPAPQTAQHPTGPAG